MRFRQLPLAAAALLAGVLLFLAAPVSAIMLVYTGTFTPEGGPGFTGTGSATIRFNLDMTLSEMSVDVTWSGTSSTSTVAHIHCCTASPNTGNAGVATQTPSFVGFPVGVTGGSYSQSFDLTMASSWNAAFIAANGSISLALSALLDGLDNDRAYFNIHTLDFPGGEIRARLAPVPEPGAALLVGVGLALIFLRRSAAGG